MSAGMRVSAEAVWLMNFAMDFLVLYLACRGTWFMRCWRLVRASAFGATCALMNALLSVPFWVNSLALAATLIYAFPARDLRELARSVFFAFCTALSMSALIRAFRPLSGLAASIALGAAAGVPLALALRRQALRARWNVRVRARFGGARTEFTALIDTGNMLCEPLSALPVLIADELALGREFLRAGMAAQGARLVEFGSVGGNGRMRCVRPDSLRVFNGKKWVCAPEMWLGLFPGRMNRGVHALAPCAVMRALPKRKSG